MELGHFQADVATWYTQAMLKGVSAKKMKASIGLRQIIIAYNRY